MEITFALSGLKLKVSCEIIRKSIFVRGHFKVVNGKVVYVKPYFRRK